MRPSPARAAFFLAFLGVTALPAIASAQTMPNVASGANNPFPVRLVNGVVQSARPINLTPLGVNYSDCIADMTLEYTVQVSGFTGQSLEAWVSQSADCTQDTTRTAIGTAQCWRVAQIGNVNVPSPTGMPITIDIPVRAIVGPQNAPAMGVTSLDATACNAQQTDAPITFTVFILAIQPPTTNVGTGFKQALTTDLVGPPPPTDFAVGIADTFLTAHWTPNIDADTAGYDLFIDPVPGSTTLVGATDATVVGSGTSSTPTLVCPDTGTAVVVDEAGLDEAGLDGSPDLDACYTINQGASSSDFTGATATNCSNGPVDVLASGIVQDSGATSATTDDSGLDEAGTTGPGGIGTILCDYLVGASCPKGQPVYTSTNLTVTGESTGSYNITGLINKQEYHVTIAAVDNSGNVGAPAGQYCQTPQPVDDFFKVYRDSGGTAGGSFCALEAVGAPAGGTALFGGVGVALAAVTRRRRRPTTR
jgi:hypothetical protein